MKWLQCIGMILIGMISFPHTGAGQLKMYSFEEVGLNQKAMKRSTVIFIYTSWCQYCQVMKNSTLANNQVIKTLNDQFYFVPLNGEEKRNILFNKHLFQYRPNGISSGTHELAEALGTINKKLAYPALVIMNSKHEIIFQYSGWLTGKALIQILNKALP